MAMGFSSRIRRMTILTGLAIGQTAGTCASWENGGSRDRAGVAELADAQDLKSWVPQGACGFDARPRHTKPPENFVPSTSPHSAADLTAPHHLRTLMPARI